MGRLVGQEVNVEGLERVEKKTPRMDIGNVSFIEKGPSSRGKNEPRPAA